MTHFTKSISLLAAFTALSACGGGGGGGEDGPVLDEPTPPSIDSGDVLAAESFIAGVNSRRDTPTISFLPIGTATYTGEMVTGLNISGDDTVDGLIGEVRLTAQLLGAGDSVTGTVSNVHTLDGNTPVELLGGQLTINGDLDDGTKRMTSTLSGQLSGVVGDGERGALNVSGTMNGRTQDTRRTTFIPNPGNVLPPPFPQLPDIPIVTYDEATGIAGSTSGSISGSESGSFSGTWAVSE